MRFERLAKLVVVLLVAATLMSFGGRYHFMFDNLSSFKVHFAAMFLICCAALIISRHYLWAALSSIGLAAHLAAIVPWYISSHDGSQAAQGKDSLLVLMSNVSLRNTDYARLRKLIADEQPDLFGLAEVNANWLEGIADVTAKYPYRFEAPDPGFWGLALYSKIPLADAGLINLADGVPPVIVATIVTDNGGIEVMLAHPRPPMNALETELRNLQMKAMALYISRSDGPLLLMGDLNTALWSPTYKDFISVSRLQNARIGGGGIGGTWPPSAAVGVPIDHILSSNALALENFRILRRIGSDHLPVAAQVILLEESFVSRPGSGSNLPHTAAGNDR